MRNPIRRLKDRWSNPFPVYDNPFEYGTVKWHICFNQWHREVEKWRVRSHWIFREQMVTTLVVGFVILLALNVWRFYGS